MSLDTQRSERAVALPPGRIALLVAGAVLLVFVGYVLGSGRSTTREVTGPVQVGDKVATMMVDGTLMRRSRCVCDMSRTADAHAM